MSTAIDAGTPAPIPSPLVGTEPPKPVPSTGVATPTPATATPTAPTPATATPTAPRKPREIVMGEAAMRDRIARAKRQALVEAFGSDNVDELRTKLERAEKLEQEAEERKRAQMTETERMKHDLARARREAHEARASARRMHVQQQVREQQSAVERLAARHISPTYVGMATLALREHLRTLSPREVDRMGDKDVAKWFQRFVAKRPEIAASAQSRRRAPAGSPRPAARPHTAPTGTSAVGGSEKSFSPSAANGMTRAEARAAAKKLGYSW